MAKPLTLFLIILTGCTASMGQARKASNLQELEKKIETLERKVWALEYDLRKDKSLYLDPTNAEGYNRVETRNGTFLIVLDSVVRHLDGYKVNLKIGNISSAIYDGFQMTFSWGRREPEPFAIESFIAWRKSLREKSSRYTTRLLPGSWNEVELIAAPAGYDELGHLELKMSTDSIVLNVR